MSGFTLIVVIAGALAAAGFAFQKNGEMAGLGRASRRGGLRAPHGRLVRTKRLDTFEELPFGAKFERVALLAAAATVLIGVLCALGVLDLASVIPVSLDAIAVMGIACGVTQGDAGLMRSLAYALVGYMAAGIAATLLGLFAFAPAFGMDTAGINALTMAAGALGAAAAVAAMPLVRTYAREFEDGHVNSIQVTSKSVAARAYDKLADPAWTPPAERVQSGGEEMGLRAAMERRRRKIENEK
ncbi:MULTISPECIES: hypothetical protein [unclassified Adlercreutzia]|uniref:hypothetical protein n=1 Tax=unclassified Adlercreutzia TaxID=2636013 RepID=UPI0013EC3A34|nr:MULTISPECIES: hypothetical protein [unclassified Adlercreutzia]